MEAAVAQAMEEGAFGLSTSLQYVPDRFARTEEIVALAKVARRYGGSYITHQRSESVRDRRQPGRGVPDRARGRDPRADLPPEDLGPAQLGPHAGGARSGSSRRARQGLDVSADQYPYIAGQNSLDANLPLWVRDGGRDKLIERLKDPALRARVKADVAREDRSWENQYLGSGGAGRAC